MEAFHAMVKNSTFTRVLALGFLTCLLLASLVVGTIELLQGQSINMYVAMVLSTGIGYCLNLLGINFGVGLTTAKQTVPQPGVSNKTQPLQVPPTTV